MFEPRMKNGNKDIIINDAVALLEQLKSFCQSVNNEMYISSLILLSNNSIGKHIRHIIEFFDILKSSHETGMLNYDNRLRDEKIETSHDNASAKIEEIINWLLSIDNDRPIDVNYGEDSTVLLSSSLYREILYNTEHTVHHMAIIKMAVAGNWPQFYLSSEFGVARSTLIYLKRQNVHSELSASS